MKYVPTIASVLLGLVFLMASVPFLLGKMGDQPAPPPGTPMAMFGEALGTTGYMKMVKVFELLGAILVMIPRTRNFGLLVLCPIVVNIVAFWVFIAHAVPPGAPLVTTLLAVVLPLYLLWDARQKFIALLN